jgi:hypothetical protein
MWVSDRTGAIASIRLLVSDDGLTWTDRGLVIDGFVEFDHLWNLAVAYRPLAGGGSPTDSVYLGFAGKGSTVTFYSSPDGETWTQEQAMTLDASHPAPLVLPDGTVRLFASATSLSSAGADGIRVDQFILHPLGDGSGYDLRLADESMSGAGALGAPGTWNDAGHLAPAVAFDGSAVHVFTAGSGLTGSSAIGLATTHPWTTGDDWSPAIGARDPEVLTDDASFTGFGPTVRYKMWHATDGGTAIQHVGSIDGDKWNVISPAVNGLAFGAANIEIVHDAAGFGHAPMTHAYRAVYRDPNVAPGITTFRTAKSLDGMTWFDDQPLVQTGTSVIAGPGTLPAWNANPGLPVELIHDPDAPATLDLVDPMNNRWVFVYSAGDGVSTSWGLAISADGFIWQGWQGGATPIFSPGSAGEWDSRFLGGGTLVARPDGGFDAWFGAGTTSADQGIGFASSDDGVTWTRCANNPILGFGGCGPQGGLACGGPAEAGNGSPTALLEESPDGGCAPQSRYRIWRGGIDGLGAGAVASSSRPAGVPVGGEILRVPEEHATIQAAIDAASPGATVLVGPGIYEENLVIDRSLQLIGADRETTIVRSADSSVQPSAVVWVRGTSGSATDCVNISGFSFDGMKGDVLRQVNTCVRTGDIDLQAMTDEAGWVPRNTEITVRDCRMENARHHGALVHACYRPSVENCVIGGFGDGFLPQQDSYTGVTVIASKYPVISGNAISIDVDPSGLSSVGGVYLDPVGTLLWEGFEVSDNLIVGPNVGGGLVINGDLDAEPTRHDDPDGRLVSGNHVDGRGRGTTGLVLRGGVYGTNVRSNEFTANGVNVWLSRTGAPGLPAVFEDNLVQGVHVLPGDHGIFLDDEDRDGLDQVHLILTGNTVRNHSGSGIFAVSKSSLSTVRIGDVADPGAGNAFFDNCRYNIELSRDADNPLDLPNNLAVDARNNWWGVDCGPGVQSTVLDRFAVQSVGLATVTMVPWTDDKFETIDGPESCLGAFTPKTLGLALDDRGADMDVTASFSFDVIAGEVEIENWIVQFPDEMVFNGFPAGTAGSWTYSGGINGSFPLIGLGTDAAYFDFDGDGSLSADDYLVYWADAELRVVLGPGSGSGVEAWSLFNTIDLAPGLFTNPPDPGSYVIESRWRSRDGRLECTSFVEEVHCTLPGSAVVGTMRVIKDPAGIRAFWPAIDTSGLDCFSGYAVIAGEDPANFGDFADRSGFDLDGVDTSFTGSLPDSYFLVVAAGPQGQLGPVAPDVFVP